MPDMKKVYGDGVVINLAVWEGEGDDILCIHGLTANCRCWDGIASSLSPRHRVWAMDLRGRGFSDKPSSGYSIEQHCHDIRALLTQLGLKRIALMGPSLGAYISLAYAAKHPEQVSRLILIDGGRNKRLKFLPGSNPRWIDWDRYFPPLTPILKI